MYLVSLVAIVALTAKNKEIGAGLVAQAAALAVDLSVGGRVGAGATASVAGGTVALAPFAVTAIGCGVLGTVLRRRLDARIGLRPIDVLAVGAQLVALFAGCVLALTVFGRMDLSKQVGSSLAVSGDIADTLLHSVPLVGSIFVVLVCWKFPAALPPPLLQARNWLAGPLYGATTALVSFSSVSFVASVTALLHAVSSSSSSLNVSDISPQLIMAAVLSPNLYLAAFPFSQGVPIEGTGELASVLSNLGGSGGLVSILDAADKEPRVWIAVAVAAVVLLVGGVSSAFFAPTPSAARKRGWGLGVTVSVLSGVISLVTRVSAGGYLHGESLDGSVSLDLGYALLLGLVWGGVAGSLGALMARVLPASFAVRRHQRIAQRRANRMLRGAGSPRSVAPSSWQ